MLLFAMDPLELLNSEQLAYACIYFILFSICCAVPLQPLVFNSSSDLLALFVSHSSDQAVVCKTA